MEDNTLRLLNYLKRPHLDSLFQAGFNSPNPDNSWLDAEMKDLRLVKYEKGSLNVLDFFEIISQNFDLRNLSTIRDVAAIKRFLQDRIRFDLTAAIGFRKGYLRLPQYKHQLADQIEKILVYNLRSKYFNKIQRYK